MSKVVYAGILVALSGVLFAAVDGERSIAVAVFVFGFYLTLIGMLLTLFRTRYSEKYPGLEIGMRIGAAGFAVAAFSPLIGMYSSEEVADNISDIGLFFVFLGIFVCIWKGNSHKNDN